MMTRYDQIINFLFNNWLIAILVVVVIIISAIPALRDGFQIVFKTLFGKKKKGELVLEYDEEVITFEIKERSTKFDVVKINAITHTLGVGAERKWIDHYYPNAEWKMQSLENIDTGADQPTLFDVINIVLVDGRKKRIFFDISSFFNSGGHTSADIDAFTRERIKSKYKR